ncbi:MAG TPA: DUF6230 family protein [Ktedonobacteraceae bacterium]|jgi:hypothetical protein|nr:DUF6230 family protein [Ktedonobacteraceae bacterium]HLI70013.1 DUF6230 family protein [Ktedonobacteraceae bacterium]
MSPTLDMPMIGQTNRNIFWIVLLVALLVLTGMLALVERGAVAVAAAIPVPFVVKGQTLNGSNFHLYPGVSGADNTTPVGVVQMNTTITDLTIIKTFNVPVLGNVNLTLTAGDNGTPVSISGLTIDSTGMNLSQAQFSGMSINASGTGGFEIGSSSATFTNATINSPYLLINSITLPGLSISLSR